MVDFAETRIETVKDYWNNRPCNIRHSNKEIGSIEYFNEVEKRKYFVEPHIPGFADFDRWRGRKVLEIGCGIGTDTINFARAGAHVTAVDLSQESLNVAQKRAEVFNLKINFYQCNIEELSKRVPVEEYDLVYSFGVIHHTPHPEKAIEEIKKYMGMNSSFKIMVYNENSWKVFWIIMRYGFGQFWKKKQLTAKYSEAQTGCPVTFTYTKRSVKELVSGFEIRDVFVDHIFPYHIPSYKKYKYKFVWYFRILPKKWFRHLEKRWGWHLCVTLIPKNA